MRYFPKEEGMDSFLVLMGVINGGLSKNPKRRTHDLVPDFLKLALEQVQFLLMSVLELLQVTRDVSKERVSCR